MQNAKLRTIAMSLRGNFLSISSSIIIFSLSYSNPLSSFLAKLRNLPVCYWNRTMIVYHLNLRTTVVFPDYQIQKVSQNVNMSSTHISRNYGNHRRGSRDSIDSGNESDYEDSDDEESNRKRISRRHKKKRVKSRIPDYDEFARFRDSSRPPDSHYTSVKHSSSSSDKESIAPQEPSAPIEKPSAPNEEPAPPDEESNTKK